tara:strand:- start:98 stop:307 length:210 start_codon:yes stop_codon:yes gene_type:complete
MGEQLRELIVFNNVPPTEKPDKFSEGLFVWVENDQIMTTLEYHCATGGDPEVYKKWEELNKAIISKKEI